MQTNQPPSYFLVASPRQVRIAPFRSFLPLCFIVRKISNLRTSLFYLAIMQGTVWTFGFFYLLCPLRTSERASWYIAVAIAIFRHTLRSPGVSTLTFGAQLLEFTVPVFDGYGFRNLTLTRPTFPPDIQFLFVSSHLCSMLPSDPTSRLRPCASLAFTSIRLAKRLSLFKLTCMPGTRLRGR